MAHNRFAVIGISLFVCFFISSFIGSMRSFIVCAVLAAAAAVTGFAAKKRPAAFAVSACAAAFLIYGIYSAAFIEPTASLKDRTVPVTASVLSTGRPGRDYAYITASGTADGIPVKFSFYSANTFISPGSTVTADITFSGLTGTASFNDSYNYSRGIFLRAYAENTEFTEGGFSLTGALAEYSEDLRCSVSAVLGKDTCGLLLAVFFGDKSRLPDSLSADIRRCGLSHFTAVSGMHLSLIVIVLMSVLGALPFGRNRIVRFISAIVLTAVFMLFFNMTASVRRSGIMLIFFYGAELFRRERSTLSSLGAALTLILLTEPYACRDAGLLLSVCGTFGAGVVSPALCRMVSAHRPVIPAAGAVITCVCASYCTIPASALIFGGFSVLSPLTSPLILPFFTAALVFTLLFVLTGGIFGFLLLPAGAVLKPVIDAIRFLAGFRYAYIVPDSEMFPAFAAAAGIFIAVTAYVVRRRRMSRRFTAYSAVIAFCALIGLVTAGRLTDSGTAKITVYSDGDDFLAAVSYRSGVSLFASGISRGLSGEAYDIMAGQSIDSFDTICVIMPENSAVYSRAFSTLPALERHFTDDSEYICDIGGKYTVSIFEDALLAEINGVSVLMTDIKTAPAYGGQDIALCAGYTGSPDIGKNGVTVLSAKRFKERPDAYNAYYKSIEIRISPDGRLRITEK